MKKTYQKLYMPLFFMSAKWIRKHIEYIVNYVVREFGLKRDVATLNVTDNIFYLLSNPYKDNKKRLILLHTIATNLRCKYAHKIKDRL